MGLWYFLLLLSLPLHTQHIQFCNINWILLPDFHSHTNNMFNVHVHTAVADILIANVNPFPVRPLSAQCVNLHPPASSMRKHMCCKEKEWETKKRAKCFFWVIRSAFDHCSDWFPSECDCCPSAVWFYIRTKHTLLETPTKAIVRVRIVENEWNYILSGQESVV